MIAILGAMAAIAGNGGLTNTNVSGYTRDQGWGMGKHVGAIPSVIGGHSVKLSHVGMVFPIDTPERPQAFRRLVSPCLPRPVLPLRHRQLHRLRACRACSRVQFLPRGTEVNTWLAAGMTADGVHNAIGPTVAERVGWFMTLFCGFLVLALSTTTTADGYFRRWIDVLWTGLPGAEVVEAAHRRQALLRDALQLLRVGTVHSDIRAART